MVQSQAQTIDTTGFEGGYALARYHGQLSAERVGVFHNAAAIFIAELAEMAGCPNDLPELLALPCDGVNVRTYSDGGELDVPVVTVPAEGIYLHELSKHYDGASPVETIAGYLADYKAGRFYLSGAPVWENAVLWECGGNDFAIDISSTFHEPHFVCEMVSICTFSSDPNLALGEPLASLDMNFGAEIIDRIWGCEALPSKSDLRLVAGSAIETERD